MTSTASRLATVQRAIEDLEAQLNPSPADRAQSLQARIEALTKELAVVKAGHIEVLDGLPAEEGIREVYQLAISLQADFRRVEDSYREADRSLRQRIIAHAAVPEPVVAGANVPTGLSQSERSLYELLLNEPRGRFEQEFLLDSFIRDTILNWADNKASMAAVDPGSPNTVPTMRRPH